MTDADHMRHALRLAERALGNVAPNPAVGCVILSREGRVAGRGWTQSGGRPHAETVALADAAEGARGGTAYVTLEPCAHLGRTPPCADALIAAGISRVVAAIEDPDPRVKGKGLARLQAAGVAVTAGVLEREAADLNAGFFLRLAEDRPLVTLKVARSRDGKTVPPKDSSRWITGEESRRFAHLLRARHDAILIGVDTALADDPELTCRLPGLEHRSPIRLVLDTRLRLPLAARVVRTARAIPTIVFTAAEGGDHLRAEGVEVLRVIHDERGKPALEAVLGVLAGRGCTRLLVEGGPTVWSAFLHEGLVGRLEIFMAPIEFGPRGSGEIGMLRDLPTSSAPFARTSARMVGADTLESYALRA